MTKLTLPSFSSLTNEASFIAALNEAMEAMEAFSDLILSLNGATPNAMTAPLDMNSQRIINLPAPVNDTDPVRLQDLTDGIQGPPGPEGAPGAPGAPIADGDRGDIVVSGSGTVLTLDPTVVTAFAKTVLDDATVADMRTTLGLGGAATLAVGTTAGTVAAGDDGRFTKYTVNDQSGATYTFATTDPGKLVRQTAGGTHTYTVNPFATTAIPVGSVILVRNAVGAGVLTLARGAGVAFYANGATTSANASLAAGAVATLVHEATDSWLVLGVGVT
jgi:hypothetical protein